jgi:two-component system, NarL family, sensor kinase
MTQPKRINYFALIFIAFSCWILLINCEKKEVKTIYIKPPEEKLDSVTTWFSTEDNFNNKNYFPLFYKYFNQKIEAKQWEEAASILFNAGRIVCINSKADSIMIKTHKDLLEKHQNDISDRYKSGLYLNLGMLYYYNSDFDLAIATLKKGTQIASKDYYSLLNLSSIYNELGYIYTETGKLDMGLEMAFKALDTSIMLKDTVGVGAAYDAISSVYRSMYDYNNAENFMNKAIVSLDSAKEYIGVLTVYENKLALYEEIDNPNLKPLIDSVYLFYQKHHFKNDTHKLYVYSWKAIQLLKEKKIAEAEKLLTEIRPLFDVSQEKFLHSKYIEAAIIYDKITGRKTISSNVYEEAIPEYKAQKDYVSLLICYDELKTEAIQKKEYKTALFYADAYNEINDSLRNKTLLIKAKELDKKYQIEKKEQQIAIQKQEITQKNTSIALLIASLFGMCLMIGGYYLWQKQKTLKQDKANSMNFTKQLLENTEDERKRIASDLHDSISHELLNLKSIFKQDLSIVNAKIDNIINDIRGISRNLHPVMFDKIGLEPNIEQLVERIQEQNDFMVNTEMNYKGSLTSADELQIYRILQEALTNIIKYANAHAAKITIEELDDKICIEIRDNGKGFNVKETLNNGKSFGLHNIIERSRFLGGKATIKSSEEGTIITINIPKKS